MAQIEAHGTPGSDCWSCGDEMSVELCENCAPHADAFLHAEHIEWVARRLAEQGE